MKGERGRRWVSRACVIDELGLRSWMNRTWEPQNAVARPWRLYVPDREILVRGAVPMNYFLLSQFT